MKLRNSVRFRSRLCRTCALGILGNFPSMNRARSSTLRPGRKLRCAQRTSPRIHLNLLHKNAGPTCGFLQRIEPRNRIFWLRAISGAWALFEVSLCRQEKGRTPTERCPAPEPEKKKENPRP